MLFRFDAPDRAPFWATPGGALDPGETFEACARRELREESGLGLDCGMEVDRRVAELVDLHGAPVLAAELADHDEHIFPSDLLAMLGRIANGD